MQRSIIADDYHSYLKKRNVLESYSQLNQHAYLEIKTIVSLIYQLMCEFDGLNFLGREEKEILRNTNYSCALYLINNKRILAITPSGSKDLKNHENMVDFINKINHQENPSEITKQLIDALSEYKYELVINTGISKKSKNILNLVTKEDSENKSKTNREYSCSEPAVLIESQKIINQTRDASVLGTAHFFTYTVINHEKQRLEPDLNQVESQSSCTRECQVHFKQEPSIYDIVKKEKTPESDYTRYLSNTISPLRLAPIFEKKLDDENFLILKTDIFELNEIIKELVSSRSSLKDKKLVLLEKYNLTVSLKTTQDCQTLIKHLKDRQGELFTEDLLNAISRLDHFSPNIDLMEFLEENVNKFLSLSLVVKCGTEKIKFAKGIFKKILSEEKIKLIKKELEEKNNQLFLEMLIQKIPEDELKALLKTVLSLVNNESVDQSHLSKEFFRLLFEKINPIPAKIVGYSQKVTIDKSTIKVIFIKLAEPIISESMAYLFKDPLQFSNLPAEYKNKLKEYIPHIIENIMGFDSTLISSYHRELFNKYFEEFLLSQCIRTIESKSGDELQVYLKNDPLSNAAKSNNQLIKQYRSKDDKTFQTVLRETQSRLEVTYSYFLTEKDIKLIRDRAMEVYIEKRQAELSEKLNQASLQKIYQLLLMTAKERRENKLINDDYDILNKDILESMEGMMLDMFFRKIISLYKPDTMDHVKKIIRNDNFRALDDIFSDLQACFKKAFLESDELKDINVNKLHSLYPKTALNLLKNAIDESLWNEIKVLINATNHELEKENDKYSKEMKKLTEYYLSDHLFFDKLKCDESKKLLSQFIKKLSQHFYCQLESKFKADRKNYKKFLHDLSDLGAFRNAVKKQWLELSAEQLASLTVILKDVSTVDVVSENALLTHGLFAKADKKPDAAMSQSHDAEGQFSASKGLK